MTPIRRIFADRQKVWQNHSQKRSAVRIQDSGVSPDRCKLMGDNFQNHSAFPFFFFFFFFFF